MFKRILVPLDGSPRAERALPIAARIAQAVGGSMILVRAVSIPMGYSPSQTQSSIFVQEVLDSKQEARNYLTALCETELLAGIPCEAEVLYGAPALAVLDRALVCKAELIVICSHGRTDTKRWVLGSVAQKIARHSEVPVLILREDGKAPLESYPDSTRPLRAFSAMVALDGSHLARQSLEPVANLVAALAAPAKGRLHMTHVVQLPSAEVMLYDEDTRGPASQEKALYQAKKYLRNVSEDLRENLPKDVKLNINWCVVVDTDVAQALIDVAEKGDVFEGTNFAGGCDLIAVTTHGRGGIQDWTIGTVAERIVNTTNLPVLIVRPQAAKNIVKLLDEETIEAEA